jgi:hypothetical protein
VALPPAATVADEELSTEIVKFAQGRTLTSTEFDEFELERAPLVSVNVAVIA